MPRARPAKTKPTGRPVMQIDWGKVDQWLIGGSKGTAIAARIGVSADTLYDRCLQEKGVSFSDYSQQKRSIGDSMIEQTQFQVGVVEKNVPMLIWLGKTRCGQTEVDPNKTTVDPKVMEAFETMMKWMASTQSERNIPNSNQSIDSISECDTGVNLAPGGNAL